MFGLLLDADKSNLNETQQKSVQESNFHKQKHYELTV